VGFWIKTPSGSNTNLTSIKFRLGTDSSNYYSWTLPALTENTWTFVKLLFTAATSTGTVTDSNINYCRLEFVTAAGYAGFAGVLVDDIRAYSGNYTKPVPTVYSYRNETTGLSSTFAHCGTSLYLYNETALVWEQIDSTITEFEVGSTTKRTRFSCVAYKNNVYFTNGVDNLRYWTGKTVTTVALLGRYLTVVANIGFLAGNDSNPSYIYYTAVAPADLTAFGSNLKVGDDDDGRINAISAVGNLVLAFKDKKIYYIDVFGSSDQVLPIDSQNGGFSQRAIANVGNGVLYFNETGIDYLQQKTGTVGASALESNSYVKQIQEAFSNISATNYNSQCAVFIPQLNNYYFTYDTSSDDSPDATLVYSSLVSALNSQSGTMKTTWTEYSYPELYCYSRYVGTDKSIKYLASSANGGIIYSIEDGFSDYGNTISYEIKTKEYDLGDVSASKEFVALDVIGVKSKGFGLSVEVLVDGEVEASGDVTDDQLTSNESVGTIGSSPLGTTVLGGSGSSNEIDIYPYLARLYFQATGRRIQVRLYSEGTSQVWTLDKLKMSYNDMSFDEFPEINKI
jgi:hypothetical protein